MNTLEKLIIADVLCVYQFPEGSLRVSNIEHLNKTAMLCVNFYGGTHWVLAAPTSVWFHIMYNPSGEMVRCVMHFDGAVTDLYNDDVDTFEALLLRIEDNLQFSLDPVYFECANAMRRWDRPKPDHVGVNIVP